MSYIETSTQRCNLGTALPSSFHPYARQHPCQRPVQADGWPLNHAQHGQPGVKQDIPYRDRLNPGDDDCGGCRHALPSPPPAGRGTDAKGSPAGKRFPRISKPLELIRSSYDCVVIGSGYGGGVAASRMARAGESVCVLERGEERWPGEYPESPWQGQSAVVCNGLGGTSLINANVFLEADARTLSMDFWPPEIRKDPRCLEPYYQKARDMLEPEPYPDHWPRLRKVEVLRRQARAMGMEHRFRKVPQTTRFRAGPNSCGVPMSASTLTGQDATGVNDGSKTTTLVTYLADAWNWGADLFCRCEVRHVEKVTDARGGYIVYFAWRGRHRDRFRGPAGDDLMWVHARRAVFLGAGAIGTTEILLRSKALGLGMSDCVGQGMSGNGDMLAFGYNLNCKVNALGKPSPTSTNPVGPTINAAIDCREGHDNPLHGFILQEGAVPQALSGMLQALVNLIPRRHAPGKTVVRQAQATLSRWKSRLLGPYTPDGAMERTQVYLVMSHDGNQGTLTLKDNKPMLAFPVVGHSEQTQRLNCLLTQATEAVGGMLVPDPYCAAMGNHGMTVHPLGGAPMSRDGSGATGVTNHAGVVFAGSDTCETHAGLIVTDGAAVPAAIGVNPLATIVALAERSVDEYARSRNLFISDEPNGVLDLNGEPAHPPKDHRHAELLKSQAVAQRFKDKDKGASDAVGFTEKLSGFIHSGTDMRSPDDSAAYEVAHRLAKSRGESANLLLSIADLDPSRPDGGIVTGTFVCPTVQGSPFMVLRGNMKLFRPDRNVSETSRLTYDLDMTGVDGRRLRLQGYKVLDSSVALNPCELWRATTTLYVAITEAAGHGRFDVQDGWASAAADHQGRGGARLVPRGSPVVGVGMLNIGVYDFLSEMLSLTSTGKHLFEKASKVAGFVSRFASRPLSVLLTPLAPLQYPAKTHGTWSTAHDYPHAAPSRRFEIEASDGVRTEMYMWDPEPGAVATDEYGSPVEVKDLFMIPGAAVDHQIFALPTIPFNAVDYFTRAGYRVFVSVHRICILEVAKGPWTTYDTRLDIEACLRRIRNLNKSDEPVYTVAHCLGSVALACGLLDGTIPASWILGITCSQVFMNPLWSLLNTIKAASPIPLDKLYWMLAGQWYDCRTSANDGLVQRVLNQLLRFYPEERREMCTNATCHRATFLFGRCWTHGNLNEATHRNIDRFFGGANMTLLNLLMFMGRRRGVTTNAREELVTPENLQRLNGMPMFLFSGASNAVLSPTATEMTYERLCDEFGMSAGMAAGGLQYRRRVIPGYGHLDSWMGQNAWRDVYPHVRQEVDRVVRGEGYCFRQPSDRFKAMVDAAGR
ncbi:hypothetical protein HIM_01432 [Hirsutella minnesotensis 3608]|nr:hypothetical protein HIM_01432 [Hirsutella minnesotensis 3608]